MISISLIVMGVFKSPISHGTSCSSLCFFGPWSFGLHCQISVCGAGQLASPL